MLPRAMFNVSVALLVAATLLLFNLTDAIVGEIAAALVGRRQGSRWRPRGLQVELGKSLRTGSLLASLARWRRLVTINAGVSVKR